MKTSYWVIILLIGVLTATPLLVSANHKAEVAEKTIVDSSDPNIKGTDAGCDSIHYHGVLNGVADPAPNGCGHGVVHTIPHGEGDGEVIPPPLPKGPSFPVRVWKWLGSWFTDGQKETIANTVDIVAESNGIPPPGTISDTVDIVNEAAPSIKANADNAEKYFDTYEDAPDRDRYTLETENPEENAPAPGFYRWFWGLFE